MTTQQERDNDRYYKQPPRRRLTPAERALIDEAVAAGRVRVFPPGATSQPQPAKQWMKAKNPSYGRKPNLVSSARRLKAAGLG